jgi:molybdopterin/thiamine biosynthesis adenylyltransferase
MNEPGEHPVGSKTIVVIGGGNVGSQLVLHLARCPAVGRLVIVDPDVVGAQNTSQGFSPPDIGRFKAIALARRARRILRQNPLRVEAIVARVENVPWGRLRGDVICGCVDSRLARSWINHIAWRLGIPWIDAGIQASGSLARVQTLIPGEDAPCMECHWGARDLELLNQAYSCDGRLREPGPTGACSALGGLAASLQALDCQKILNGSIEQSLRGRQLIVEAKFHHQYVNTLSFNPVCRFDHKIWSIQRAPATVRTVGDLFEHGRKFFGELPAAIGAERKSWVTRLACRECGQQARALRLQGRIGPRLRRCGQCGGDLQPIGFHLRARIDLHSAGERLLARPLRHVGLRGGDVLTLSGAHPDQHIELSPTEEPGRN